VTTDDAAALEAFLRSVADDVDAVTVRSIAPIGGGYSRVMMRAEVEWSHPGGRRLETLVLRADPPPGAAAFETDRDAEWAILSALDGRVPMPSARYYDAQGALGAKTIVLDHVSGPSLLGHLTTGVELGPVAAQIAEVAAAVHAVDLDHLPADVTRPAEWSTYLDSLIAQWAAAERAHVERDPFMRHVGAWLDTHRPAPAPLTLVHGDFQSANLLVSDDALVLVDWEFAHVGDPREDLGWFMAVAMAAPPDPISHDLDAFCARYRELTGIGDEVVNPWSLGYFVVLGAIRIFANLIAQNAAFVRGDVASITVPYNVNAAAFAHSVWLTAIAGLEAMGAPTP
jgi:aminoglycoside phosphotransferase (APT) family kinase protein